MSDILGGIGNAVGDLGSAANGLFGGSDPNEVPVANAGKGIPILDPITSDLGGVLSGVGGALTSLVPGPTVSLPPVLPLPSTTPNSLSANPSASGSIVSASSLGLSSVAPLSSSIPLPSSTPPPAFSSAPQSAAADLNPATQTSIQVVTGPPAATSAPATAPKGFLQNKPLAGAVFGLAGLIGLVLIVVIATWALRRKRRGHLMDEAISFEPTAQHSYAEDMERLNEKNNSTESYGRSYGAAAGYNVNPAQAYPAYNQPYPQYSSPSQLVNGGYTGR